MIEGEAVRRRFHGGARVLAVALVVGAIGLGNAAYQTGNLLGGALAKEVADVVRKGGRGEEIHAFQKGREGDRRSGIAGTVASQADGEFGAVPRQFADHMEHQIEARSS